MYFRVIRQKKFRKSPKLAHYPDPTNTRTHCAQFNYKYEKHGAYLCISSINAFFFHLSFKMVVDTTKLVLIKAIGEENCLIRKQLDLQER